MVVYHWKSAMKVVLILYDSTGTATSYPLHPVDNLRLSERSEKDIRDSTSQGNQQKIHRWHRYRFDLRLPAVADNVGALIWLQKHDQDFDIRVTEETNETNTDLVVKTVTMNDCSVENIDYVIASNDVPTLVITGVAMDHQAMANAKEINDSRGSSESVPS